MKIQKAIMAKRAGNRKVAVCVRGQQSQNKIVVVLTNW